MNSKLREVILNKWQDDQHGGLTKMDYDWKLGKPLWWGVTRHGFPWVAFETTNFGSLIVGESRTGVKPQSHIRNDASSGINVMSIESAARSAERMSMEIVY